MDCSICFDAMRFPYVISCGHNFCINCATVLVKNSFGEGTELNCPHCRETVSSIAPLYFYSSCGEKEETSEVKEKKEFLKRYLKGKSKEKTTEFRFEEISSELESIEREDIARSLYSISISRLPNREEYPALASFIIRNTRPIEPVRGETSLQSTRQNDQPRNFPNWIRENDLSSFCDNGFTRCAFYILCQRLPYKYILSICLGKCISRLENKVKNCTIQDLSRTITIEEMETALVEGLKTKDNPSIRKEVFDLEILGNLDFNFLKYIAQEMKVATGIKNKNSLHEILNGKAIPSHIHLRRRIR